MIFPVARIMAAGRGICGFGSFVAATGAARIISVRILQGKSGFENLF
jgi:hypothetical protein